MQITKTSKVVAAVVGFALALTVFAAVGASTASAQSMTLSQLVDLFISLGIISPEKAAQAKAAVTSSASAVSFTRDLTVGSSGADVTALQNAIGVSPATGYFGSVTKSAVMAYQASKGIPATGYVGPLTRASLNSAVTTTTTTTTTTTGTPVVNSGVEGTLSVTQSNSGVASTVYEGDKMATILGFKAEAKNSDISIQRVKLDLGNSTAIYNKIYDTVYVTEGGRVLAQADLNSNTVVKDGSTYYITLAGFSLVVPRNETKTILIKADVKPSIDSTDLSTDRTVRLAANGVRGVDGAGIDQYSPAAATDVSRTINVDGDLSEDANIRISTNGSSPKAQDVVADQGSSDDELDRVNVLAFDLKAEKDDVLVTDIVVDVVKEGTGAATASSTVYLFDGSTELDSVTVSGGTATFSDVDVLVAKDTAKTLWVKADIRDANGTVSQISANIDTADITAENSQGDSADVSGSASGEVLYVRNAGIQVSLVGTPTISKTTNTNQDISTTTASVTFNVKLTAVGDAIRFGTQSASSTFGMQVYQNDAAATILVASSTSFQQPSAGSGVTISGLGANESFKLDEGASVTVPVTFTFENRTAAGALLSTSQNFKVAISSIKWATDSAPTVENTTTFMSGKTEWRSASVF